MSKKLGNLRQVKFSIPNPFSQPIYWFTNIRIKEKKSLSKYLLKNKIEVREFFTPMHLQKCFEKNKDVLNRNKKFKISTKICNTGLCLPSSVNMFKISSLFLIPTS